MKPLANLLREPAFHILLFWFTFVLFNWPFLGMFHWNLPGTLFVYLFLIWGGAIFCLLLISRSCKSTCAEQPGSEGTEDV